MCFNPSLNMNPKHGGSRLGAGRPALAGPTTTMTFRIPTEDIERLRAIGVSNISRFYVETGKKAIKRLKLKSPD